MTADSNRDTTNKVKSRIPEIIQGIQEGKQIIEIAEDTGVSRASIYRNMQTRDFIETLAETVTKRSEEHWQRINELYASESIENKREALKEAGRMIRALIPRLQITQSTTIEHKIAEQREVRLDIDKLTPEQQRHMADILLKLKE